MPIHVLLKRFWHGPERGGEGRWVGGNGSLEFLEAGVSSYHS